MSVEGKEGATVRNALYFDVRIEAVEAVCQEVTVGIHSKPSCRHPSEHYLNYFHMYLVSILLNERVLLTSSASVIQVFCMRSSMIAMTMYLP